MNRGLAALVLVCYVMLQLTACGHAIAVEAKLDALLATHCVRVD